MSQKNNLISGEIPKELITEIKTTLIRWSSQLPLTALTKDERQELSKPGDEGVDAAGSMAETAAVHSTYFSKEIADPEEILRDVELAEDLGQISHAMHSFAQAVDDTRLAARSDAYRNGLKLYAIAKVLCGQIPGLEEKIAPFKDRLDRVSRKTKKEA